MKHYLFIALFCPSIFALVGGIEARQPTPEYLKEHKGKVGVREGYFPSSVFTAAGGFGCTATAVNEVAILTAAHCVVEEEGDRSLMPELEPGKKMKFDTRVKWDQQTWTNRGVEIYRTFVHPSYYYAGMNDATPQSAVDIAVIVFKEPHGVPVAEIDFTPFDVQKDFGVKAGYGCESQKKDELVLGSHYTNKFDVQPLPPPEDAFLKGQDSTIVREFRTVIDDFYTPTKGWFYSDELLGRPATLCSGDSGGGFYKFNETTREAKLAGVNSLSRMSPDKKIERVEVDLHTRIDSESATRADLWLKRALEVDPAKGGVWWEGVSFDFIVPRADGDKKDLTVRSSLRTAANRFLVEVAAVEGEGPCVKKLESIEIVPTGEKDAPAVKLTLAEMKSVGTRLDQYVWTSPDGKPVTPMSLKLTFADRDTESERKPPLCYLTAYAEMTLPKK